MKSVVDRHELNAFSVCYIMFFEYINYFVHTVLKVLGIQIGFTTTLLLACSLLFLGVLIVTNVRRLLPAVLLPLIITILYFASSLLLNTNAQYLHNSVPEKLFLYCLPTFTAVRLISNYEVFHKTLQKFCILILITQCLSIFLMTYAPQYFIDTDYQGISYGLLIPFIFFAGISSQKKINLTIAIFTFLLLLFFGGRGPILCALLFVIYKMLLNIQKNKLWILLLAIFTLIFFLTYKDILDAVIRISDQNGFAGSIAKYANMGDVFSDSGRNNIYDIARLIIADNPMLGHGLGSTRYYLGVFGFRFGNYPHNIVLEFFCDYGVIIGTVLLILMSWKIITAFRMRNQNIYAAGLFEICFFSTGFLILLFSSSYLFCPLFFAMLAIVPVFNERKNKVYEKDRNFNIS